MPDFERLARERLQAEEAERQKRQLDDANRASDQRLRAQEAQRSLDKVQALRRALFSRSGASSILADFQVQILGGIGSIKPGNESDSDFVTLAYEIKSYSERIEEESRNVKGRYRAEYHDAWMTGGPSGNGGRRTEDHYFDMNGEHVVLTDVVRGVFESTSPYSIRLGVFTSTEDSFTGFEGSTRKAFQLPIGSAEASSQLRGFYTDRLADIATADKRSGKDTLTRIREEERKRQSIMSRIGERRPVEVVYTMRKEGFGDKARYYPSGYHADPFRNFPKA